MKRIGGHAQRRPGQRRPGQRRPGQRRLTRTEHMGPRRNASRPQRRKKTSEHQRSKVVFSASVSGTKESVSRSAQYSSAHGSSIGCERFQRM